MKYLIYFLFLFGGTLQAQSRSEQVARSIIFNIHLDSGYYFKIIWGSGKEETIDDLFRRDSIIKNHSDTFYSGDDVWKWNFGIRKGDTLVDWPLILDGVDTVYRYKTWDSIWISRTRHSDIQIVKNWPRLLQHYHNNLWVPGYPYFEVNGLGEYRMRINEKQIWIFPKNQDCYGAMDLEAYQPNLCHLMQASDTTDALLDFYKQRHEWDSIAYREILKDNWKKTTQ